MNEFIPPRPCPIFEPSDEEFKDPLTYIAKIKPIAEKFGICKIKPPLNWQPPFAVNIDKVRFTPRLQRLNELEATTRIKLNFLDQIARFWDLQGFKLRIPQVDRKPLDLYSFYRAVKNEGGYNIVVRDRKWAKISVYLGYSPHNKSVGGILRQHYEKILLPFHLFKSGESLDIIKNREKYGDFYDNNEKDENYTPHAIPYRQSIKLPLENKESYTRRTKRFQSNQSDTPTTIDLSTNNELKKLQFYGAGPKLPGVTHYIKDETKSDDCSIFSIKSPTPTSSFMASNSPNSCGTDEDVITSYSSLEGVSIIQKKASLPELSSAGDNDNLFLTKLLNVSSSFSSKIVYPSTMTSSLCSTAITAAPAFKTNPENSQFTGLFRLRPPSPSLSTIDSSPSTIVPSLLNKGEKVENLFTQLSSRVFSSTTANDSNNNNTNLKETAVRSALLGGSISSSLKLGNSPLTTLSGSAVMKEFSTNSNLSSSVAASAAAAAAALVFPSRKVATIKPNATTPTSINFLNIENVCCHTCGSGDDESRLLLCESCDLSFHTFCLVPPLKEVPKGDWRCPLCIANVCKNLIAPFGFEQSCKEYTLHSFGEMADEFKATYFNMPFHMVPTQTVEKEFWRLVSSIVEDITVCYGADLHCIEHGSGFPTESFKDKFSGEEDYIYSPWNLNNLPVLNKSILKYISGDISGMKVPWMYVGMCFSTFCWHTEDHWSYSINYLHWGEPKTWYGVPGSGATLLESVMKAQVPELFESQKDLLHHLVTLMNPNILMANGVPVCRCDQYPGEFMVTFPRAYHAGFNQGYNLAEAVNFCPSDWIPIGRNCVSHYRDLKRFCVFSHDELICKMATCPEHLDLSVANATLTDMAYMIEEERKLRKLLYQKGVTKADREIYELLSDDERKCDWCNTTCFLSALTCNCVPNKIVCLYDIDHLCKSCKPIDLCLKYRYTLDELPSMYNQLKTHVEFFQNWCKRVKECLERRGKKEGTREDKIITTTTSKAQHLYDDDIKCEITISDGDVEDEDVPKISSLEDLKILYKESLYKKFPPSDLTNLLISQIEKAEKYGERTKEILKKIYLKNKVPRKQRLNVHNYKDFGMIRFEDLRKLVSEIKALPCSLKEETEMEELLAKSIELIEKMYSALTDKIPDVSKLQELVESKLLNLLYIPERDRLQNAYEVGIWLAEVRGKLSQPELVTIEDIQKLMNRGESIKIDDDTTNHPALNKCLLEMAEIVAAAKAWEDKAQNLLSNKPTLACLEAFMSEMGPVPLHLPNVNEIKDYIGKANEALIQMNAILKGETILSIHEMGSLLESYQSFPLKFENPEFVQFETWTRSCTSWKERAIRCFLKKNSIYTLDEVICPRSHSSQMISPALLPPPLPSCKEKVPPMSKKRNKNFNKEILPSNTKIVGTLFEELVSEIKRLSNTTTAPNDNQLISSKDVDNQLMNMYENFEWKELEHVEEVRALNNEKYQMYSLLLTRRQSLSIYLDNSADNTNAEEGDDEKFCKCTAGKFIPPMLCCQICREWFHHDCILPSKFVQTLHNLVAKTKKIALPHILSSASPQKTITEYDNEEVTLINPPLEEETAASSNTNIPYVNLDAKFLCPECLRSRRPKLETAFSLLISLQKLPVKVVESYALQALTERAVKWQENVQKFLTEPEVVLFLMACKERKTVKRLQKCTSSFLANSVVDKTSRIDIVEPCKTTILGSAPLQYKTPSETISSLDFSSSVSVPSTSLNNLGLNMNTANSAIASAGPVALKSVRIGSINLNNNTQQLINNQQQNYNNNNNNLFNSIISPTSISIQPNTVLSLDSTPPTNTVEKDCFKDDSSFLKISLPTTLATLSIQKLTNLMAAGAHSSSGTPQLFLRSAAPPQTLKFYRKTVTTGGGGEDENDPKFNFTARKNEQLDLGCDFGLQNLSDDNLVCLKDSRVRELERLMLEGDLIELTLHETQHLWEIYKEALLYLRRENIRKGDNPFKTHQEFVELGDVASVYSYMCSGKCNNDESEQCGRFDDYDRYVNQSPLHKDINQLGSGPARQCGGKRKQNLSSKAVMKRNINSPNNSCDYYDGGVEEDLKKDESGIMAPSSNIIDKQSHWKKTRKTIPKDLPTPATNDDHSYESKILSTQTNTMQGSKSKYPDTLEELGLIATPSIETTEEFVRNKETKPKNSNNIAPSSKTTKLLSQLKRKNHQQLTQKLKNKKAKMFRKSRKVPNRVRVNFPDKTNLRATYLAKADQGQIDKIAIVNDDDVEKQIINTDTPNYLVGNHAKPAKVRVRRKPLKYLNTFSERSSNSSRARTSAKKDGKMNISAKRAKMSGDRNEETDENSKCSLPDCLEPTGSDITWVQCDGGCDQWFHVTCVGLNQFQINDNDDYYCYKCKETCDFNENQFTKISEFKQNEKSMD